jgi:hypothetical protein
MSHRHSAQAAAIATTKDVVFADIRARPDLNAAILRAMQSRDMDMQVARHMLMHFASAALRSICVTMLLHFQQNYYFAVASQPDESITRDQRPPLPHASA